MGSCSGARVGFVALALALVNVSVVMAPDAAGAGTEPRPRYQPPVEGQITDHFREPPTPYAAGNRGLDYLTAPGTAVRAAAEGEVVFAGPVAGALHVTIRHADGLRSSYSFLAVVLVRKGDHVVAGAPIGATGELFHFGIRDDHDRYLDPEALFAGPRVAHLVPSGDDGAPPGSVPRSEAQALGAVAARRLAPLAAALGRARGVAMSPDTALARLRVFAHYYAEQRLDTHAVRFGLGLARWHHERDDCTPAAVPQPRVTSRRIVVEVGGIGSTSELAAVANLDTAALGYAPGDVLRFSYRGGRVPGGTAAGALASVPVSAYDARDSQEDLGESSARLEALLEDIARREPGVPIDLVAHSQGGVVARLALLQGERGHTLPAEVQTVVTLGAPHQGTNAATAVDAVGQDPGGRATLEVVRRGIGLELDPDLPSGRQLSQLSPVIAELADSPLPPSVRLTSIGARGDLVVPAGRTGTGRGGAHETVVALVGLHAHDGLPGSPEAAREVALAVTGRPPTCRSLGQATADLLVSDAISYVEDRAGATAVDAFSATPP